jgi:ABC-2 type transport system ATP-binding protein
VIDAASGRSRADSAGADSGGAFAVDVRGLTKAYGNVEALAGVDLRIEHGEVFALLGPNGAGKTTTVEILEGYRRRDTGEVRVLGLDPGRQRARLKERVGIVLQSTGVDRYLTVAETISMYSGYYRHPRPVDEVVEMVGLVGKRNSRVAKLSGGQQRRLDVAIALAGDPELLFLDEPTTGFDPSARHEAWQVVKNLAALGKTVLLTTHYMDEAQFLADRVAIIASGRIVAEGSPATLAGRDIAGPRVRYRVPAGIAPPNELGGRPTSDGFVELEPSDLTQTLHQLTGWAIENGIALNELTIDRPSLEDIYLKLTGDLPSPEASTVGTEADGRSR